MPWWALCFLKNAVGSESLEVNWVVCEEYLLGSVENSIAVELLGFLLKEACQVYPHEACSLGERRAYRYLDAPAGALKLAVSNACPYPRRDTNEKLDEGPHASIVRPQSPLLCPLPHIAAPDGPGVYHPGISSPGMRRTKKKAPLKRGFRCRGGI